MADHTTDQTRAPDRTTAVRSGPVLDSRPDRTGVPGPVRSIPPGRGATLAVLVLTGAAIGVIAFLFSFGNVKDFAESIGIIKEIAPFVAPTVDLSVIGLMVAVQWLTLAGATADELRPARRLLVSCGIAMMLLNSAPSLVVGFVDGQPKAFGRAAVEAVAPWLLIAWTHVGPKMIRLFVQLRTRHEQALHDAARAEAARQAEAEQLAAAERQGEADRRAAAERARYEAEQLAARQTAEQQRREQAERLAAAERQTEADRAARAAAAEHEALVEIARLEAEQAAAKLEAERVALARAEAERSAAEAKLEADRRAAERRTNRTGPRARASDRTGPDRTTGDPASDRTATVTPISAGRTGPAAAENARLLADRYGERVPGQKEVQRDLQWGAGRARAAIAELARMRQTS